MFHSVPKRPDWTLADRECDITDVWMEETDPENELGEVATAFLSFTSDGWPVLDGISVKDTTGTMYFGSLRATRLLGLDAVHRILNHEMEAAR